MLFAVLAFCAWCLGTSVYGDGTINAVDVTTIRLKQGFLLGRHVQSRGGGIYFSFQGVPYARPPVGPLRFKDAQSPEPWSGQLEAFKEGHKCTQFDVELQDYTGEEDCLFLNVYTPRLPSSDDEPLPVMVYIHGGGFVFGSGNAEFYGPDYLVSEGVVLVTINYRLGPFGFLYLDEVAPGNAGLKDQVMALRWVQKNIAAFGGDPDKVTIFGESAGGASVHLHMLSPMSKGLFHRAIAQSGAALNPWAIQTEPVETTKRLARAVGCTAEAASAILECLRGVDYLRLMKAARTEAPTEQDRARLLKFSFVPTQEYKVDGVETFLSEPVEQLMREGRHHDVPYMTGITSQEGVLILAFNAAIDFQDEGVQRELDAAWEKNVLPELRLAGRGGRRSNGEVLAALRDFYLDGKPLTNDNLRAYINMFSDITFGEGVAYAINRMAENSKAPLYLYCFTVDDELNFLKKGFEINWAGASHADDLGYLFDVERLRSVPDSSPAALARRRVVRLWTNFAKTADPTPTDDALLGAKWKPYTEEERNFLDIGSKLQPGIDLYPNRTTFWEMLYLTYDT